jgi:diacylglycerol kinase
LMMQRRRKINRMWYAVWYTNDALILAWEREQCIRQAKELAQ